MDRAYFIAQHADAALSHADRVAKFGEHRIIVANPSLSKEQVTRLKEVRLVDGSWKGRNPLVLAYENCLDWSAHLYADGSEYWRLKHHMAPDLLPVSFYSTPDDVDVPGYILTQDVAENLVQFHAGYTMQAGFDGLYLDRCNRRLPDWVLEQLKDGIGSRKANAAQLNYVEGRAAFTSALRATFPDDLLMANTSGDLLDRNLDGLTLEDVGARLDPAWAIGMCMKQLQNARVPELACVIWWIEKKSSMQQAVVEHNARLLTGLVLAGDMGGVPGAIDVPGTEEETETTEEAETE